MDQIRFMMKHNVFKPLTDHIKIRRDQRLHCNGCAVGKSTRNEFHSYSSRIQPHSPMIAVFVDNSGQVEIPDLASNELVKKLYDSFGQFKYLSLMVDGSSSRYMMVKLLKSKKQTGDFILEALAKGRTQSGHKCKRIYGDDSGEFRETTLVNELKRRGIQRILTTKSTPQNNGIAERPFRSIWDSVRALLHQANLHKVFWPFAVLVAAYVLNLTCPDYSTRKSRYELFHHSKPPAKRLAVFGCDAFCHVLKEDRQSKVEETAIPCIFLGYDLERENGYILFNPATMKLLSSSRDVIFREDEFTFGRDILGIAANKVSANDSNKSIVNNKKIVKKRKAPDIESSDSEGSKVDLDYKSPEPKQARIITRPLRQPPIQSSLNSDGFLHSLLPDQFRTINELIEEQQRRQAENDHRFEYDLSPRNHSGPVSEEEINSVEEGPSSYQLAIISRDADNWIDATNRELKVHEENNTYRLVDYEPWMNIIPCRWVYVIKTNPNTGDRTYKARLVAKGFRQIVGLDFQDDEISSSVLGAKSLRIFLSIVARFRYQLHQMDAVAAFTQANVKESLYIEIPDGYKLPAGTKRMVLQLNKAIYGLKQSSYLWQMALRKYFLANGWTSCVLEENLFFKMSKNNQIMLAGIYVDDIISAFDASDCNEHAEFVQHISQAFKLKLIGVPSAILGMKIEQFKQGIKLSHEEYINKVLNRFQMGNCNSFPTPASDEKLSELDSPNTNEERQLMAKVPYRSLIGELLYLAIMTRPDIAQMVSFLSRFQENPGRKHWVAAKRILSYLKGTKQIGLTFPYQSQRELLAYSDANWASDDLNRKSVHGFIITLFGCPIIWLSKKQSLVALSTCEAEYIGMSEATREIRWVDQLLKEMNIRVSIPILRCDNEAAENIASTTRMDHRIKSIDIKYHYIKFEVRQKQLLLAHVESKSNVADIFTKPLKETPFKLFRNAIMNNQ